MANRESDRAKCDSRVKNLYLVLRDDIRVPNQRFVVEELLATEKCQEYYDLKTVREATVSELMAKSAADDGLATARHSEELCASVVAHHHAWFEEVIRAQLPWQTRWWYIANDNHVLSAAFVGGTYGALVRSPAVAGMASGAMSCAFKLMRREKRK